MNITDKIDETYQEDLKRYIRLREHVPLSIKKFRIDRSNIYETHESSKRSYIVKIDEDGFIFPSSVHADPDIKIVFLGGSTTECLMMNDNERFPYLVGRYLERSGLRVNSYNGGVSGNNSMHSINILLNKVLPMEPDFVVFMHNINDLTPLMYYGTYWNNNATRSLVGQARERGAAHHLFEVVKRLAKTLLPRIYERLTEVKSDWLERQGTDEWQDQRSAKLVVDESHIKQQYRRALLSFIQIAKAHSIVPVLMTQARRASLSGVADEDKDQWLLRTKLFDQFNDIVREVGVSEGVEVIDLNELVPKDKEFMYDSLHYTPKGSGLVAKIVTSHFEANLLSN